MSTNLDLVRSIYADWKRGDFSRADWADPEIEYTFGTFPGTTWKGLAGMAEGAREGIEAFEDISIEPEDFRELDAERVLALDRRRGRGKGSDLRFGTARMLPGAGAHLFHIRNGKVIRLVVYAHRDSALADLGLEQ